VITERDELIQALKDHGMSWDPVQIELPSGAPGVIDEVRTAGDDHGQFIVVVVRPTDA
jgi:hypothetical protein